LTCVTIDGGRCLVDATVHPPSGAPSETLSVFLVQMAVKSTEKVHS
jgi:hypothetical protein